MKTRIAYLAALAFLLGISANVQRHAIDASEVKSAGHDGSLEIDIQIKPEELEEPEHPEDPRAPEDSEEPENSRVPEEPEEPAFPRASEDSEESKYPSAPEDPEDIRYLLSI